MKCITLKLITCVDLPKFIEGYGERGGLGDVAEVVVAQFNVKFSANMAMMLPSALIISNMTLFHLYIPLYTTPNSNYSFPWKSQACTLTQGTFPQPPLPWQTPSCTLPWPYSTSQYYGPSRAMPYQGMFSINKILFLNPPWCLPLWHLLNLVLRCLLKILTLLALWTGSLTSALHHVTTNAQNIHHFSPFEGTDQIIFGSGQSLFIPVNLALRILLKIDLSMEKDVAF